MSFDIAKKPLQSSISKKKQESVYGTTRGYHAVQNNPQVPAIQRKLTCPCGGGCPRCQRGELPIQTKLRIGAPNDKYEQEADRVADQVMRMSVPNIHRKAECSSCGDVDEEKQIQTKPIGNQITPLVQRQEETGIEEEEEEETIQAKSIPGKSVEAPLSLPNQIQSLKGSSKPLSKSVRSFFDPLFDQDFSQVRIHENSKANQLAQAVNARAFTMGHDIVFSTGQYSPESSEGKRLVAHELTHIMQQQDASQSLIIQRQTVKGDLASKSELVADNFNWHLAEQNLASGKNNKIKPTTIGSLMVSGKGYAFGIKFTSKCKESLVQEVKTRTGFFSVKGSPLGSLSPDFVELFAVKKGKAVGIDRHTHPTPSPRFLKKRGIVGAASRCVKKDFEICCGNYDGQTVPRGKKSLTKRRYDPKKINCSGSVLTYQINYCTNGQDFSLQVNNFGVNITSLAGVPKSSGLVASINFTVEMHQRLDRHSIQGSREVERNIIINPDAKKFVQKQGVNGTEALFYANGNVKEAKRILSKLTSFRKKYETCLTAVINKSQRTPEQWSVFVRRQLMKKGFGLCRKFTKH